MVIKRLFWCITLLLGTLVPVAGQTKKDRWIDSVYQTLSDDQKIAQLFIIPIPSHLNDQAADEVESKIKNEGIGGLIFTTGHPLKQAAMVNRFQALAATPMLIGQDASAGLGTHLDSAITFPSGLAQGAVVSDTLIYRMARETARQLKLVGVNINLAPSANLTNTHDYVYRTQSFGEDKYAVSRKTLSYLKGLHAEGMLGCAKYFPIQGITITDVQNGLPVLQPYVDTVQSYPFQLLFRNGLTAVMPAANDLPLFYQSKKAARKNKFSGKALSAVFARDWIEKQMNFNGLVIVDIDRLRSSSRKFKAGDAELFAFQAGNDMLITSGNVGTALRKIKKLVNKEAMYRAQLEANVKKILAAKYDAGLTQKPRVDLENLMRKLNSPEAKMLQRELFREAVTVVRNQNNTLPVLALENKKFVCIVAGETQNPNAFQRMVQRYVQAPSITINDVSDTEPLTQAIAGKDVIIVAFTSSATEPVVRSIMSVLQTKKPEQEVIIVDFGCVGLDGHLQSFPTIIAGFTDQDEMFTTMPQVIFGATAANGALPISMAGLQPGASQPTRGLRRLQYSFPEDAGMHSGTLTKIESVAREAIATGATPGCHVLVARQGKIVYEKSFGHLTYEKQIPVTDSTIYDLASVTKVTATLQTTMFMHDRHLIDIHKKASVYLPELKNSNKKDFTLKDILTHQAGLWPFLPFWAQTMKDSLHLPEYYAASPSLQHPYMVANKLYASSVMRDSLWGWIVNAKIREKPARTPYDYRYSDMGFYILQHVAEKVLNQPMEDFLEQNLYEPLGAYTTGYQPLLRFPVSRIAPTENDKLFRKTLLIGTVHDQGAAMHGGVAGHAGLFSTANDLAKLGQMLLQEGYYGGYQYYRPETVRFFTRKQFETSRRGLGWDKPVQSDWKNTPTSLFASPATFGHTGFTGTCIWIDPEFDLVYIFLSNRVHPDMTNNKLLNANIRSRIQDVIYQSIFDYCKTGHDDPVADPGLTTYINGTSSRK